MDFEMVTIRTIHIVVGAFWAGTAIFFAFIMTPQLQKLGPPIMGPVTGALAPVMAKVILTAASITIVMGVVLALRLPGVDMDTYVSTGWGVAILIGFLASIGAFTTGLMTSKLAKRMVALGGEIAGRAPTPEEGAEMQSPSARLPRIGHATAVVWIIAVASLVAARFV